MKRLFSFFLAISLSTSLFARPDTIRVLCIGNSFSWDAVEQELAPMMRQANRPVQIVNMYYGGCSLEQHYRFLSENSPVYSKRVVTPLRRTHYYDGSDPYARENRIVSERVRMRDVLRSQHFDYVSLQQASHFSGKWETYEPFLSALIDSVRRYQPKARLCWMQTWAYSADSQHKSFPVYQFNQQVMYDSIMSCTVKLMQYHPELTIIPCGTAIQYARQTMGDMLCRDGFHLHMQQGRYTASCVWYQLLSHRSPIGLRKTPGMKLKTKRQAQKAAKKACTEPLWGQK